MIEIIIFHLHILAALYVFTKSWQNSSIKDGLLSIAVIALFFTIGWALTGTIANLFYPDSWNTIYFNSDTFGLVLLVIPEIIFFYKFFLKDKS